MKFTAILILALAIGSSIALTTRPAHKEGSQRSAAKLPVVPAVNPLSAIRKATFFFTPASLRDQFKPETTVQDIVKAWAVAHEKWTTISEPALEKYNDLVSSRDLNNVDLKYQWVTINVRQLHDAIPKILGEYSQIHLANQPEVSKILIKQIKRCKRGAIFRRFRNQGEASQNNAANVREIFQTISVACANKEAIDILLWSGSKNGVFREQSAVTEENRTFAKKLVTRWLAWNFAHAYETCPARRI